MIAEFATPIVNFSHFINKGTKLHAAWMLVSVIFFYIFKAVWYFFLIWEELNELIFRREIDFYNLFPFGV